MLRRHPCQRSAPSGNINSVIRKLVKNGLDPIEAIKMATINAAKEYKFDDLGAVAPGYAADMQIVSSLDGEKPMAVFIEEGLWRKTVNTCAG